MSIAIAIADRFLACDEDDDDDAALGRRMSDYAECPTTTLSYSTHTNRHVCDVCAAGEKKSREGWMWFFGGRYLYGARACSLWVYSMVLKTRVVIFSQAGTEMAIRLYFSRTFGAIVLENAETCSHERFLYTNAPISWW